MKNFIEKYGIWFVVPGMLIWLRWMIFLLLFRPEYSLFDKWWEMGLLILGLIFMLVPTIQQHWTQKNSKK